MVHWRKEWHTTSVFLPSEPHEQKTKMNKCKKRKPTTRIRVTDTKNKPLLVRAGMSEKVRKIKRYKLPGIK